MGRPAPQGKYLINLTWSAGLTLTLIPKKEIISKIPRNPQKNMKKFQKIFQKFPPKNSKVTKT